MKTTPLWWDDASPPYLESQTLPKSVDVLIIGSGYTGLNAAIQTARAGRSTLVIDAQGAGWGCSTRNGGQVAMGIKPNYAELSRKYGKQKAINILQEGHDALAWIKSFVADEQIDCDFQHAGHFDGAHNSNAFKQICAGVKESSPGLYTEAHIVTKAELHTEIGTDRYYGGVVYPEDASLQPARYHSGLMQKALDAGVTIIPDCKALNIVKASIGQLVTTEKGDVIAAKVIVATNGYTGSLLPWLQRRVIPIGSCIISTEELPKEQIDRLMPTQRNVCDTRKVVYYYRASPDRKRIVFGGRVAARDIPPEKSAPLLKRDLVGLFPELADVQISHSWSGFVAFTFDELPHIGEHEGIHFVTGYCGSGVAMSSYLGMKMGQQVLGLKEGNIAFDDLKFETRPLYTGKPWFLPPMVQYYRWRDKQNW